MTDEQQRRERARQDAQERRERERRNTEIQAKRQQAAETAPDPEDVQGPPWNTAVLLYLQALDRRLDHIEDELGVSDGAE